MSVEKYQFQYEVYKSIDDLLEEDKNLVIASRETISEPDAELSEVNPTRLAFNVSISSIRKLSWVFALTGASNPA